MDRSKFDELMAKSAPEGKMYTEEELEELVRQAKQEAELNAIQAVIAEGGAGGPGQIVSTYGGTTKMVTEDVIRDVEQKFTKSIEQMEEEMQRLAGVSTLEHAPTGMQFGFDVVEVQRVGLQPGDVLMVTVKNNDLSQQSVDSLRLQLQTVFPNNKVFVFAMGTSDDVQLKIVGEENPLAIKSNPGYCSDCDCGKKAIAESEDDHMKNLAKQAGE